MAIQGKKINELDLLQEDLTGNTVIPAVYVGNTTSTTANKITINQISDKIQTDMSTILVNKQDKLTAGEGITISEENVISADTPSDVYTEDNLVAGSNISFIEGVKDENTILLAPYRGTYNNQYFHSAGLDISNYDISLPSQLTTITDDEGTTFKYATPSILGFDFNNTNSFTFECWVKSDYEIYFDLDAEHDDHWWGIVLGHGEELLTFPMRNSYTLPDLTKYNHYALVFDKGDLSYFLNGTKLETYQINVGYQVDFAVDGSYNPPSDNKVSIHDLRISNIARYDADFTPTEHFEIVEATAVNCTLDISGKQDKSNLVTSLSSSSTDTQYPSAKCVYDAISQSSGGTPTLTWYVGNTGTTLTITDTSTSSLVKVYKNGILLQPTDDYSISGTTLTLVTALVASDKITTEIF